MFDTEAWYLRIQRRWLSSLPWGQEKQEGEIDLKVGT